MSVFLAYYLLSIILFPFVLYIDTLIWEKEYDIARHSGYYEFVVGCAWCLSFICNIYMIGGWFVKYIKHGR